MRQYWLKYPPRQKNQIFYSWQPTTGLSNANIANPVAHPSVTTQYVLTVTDTNTWACNPVMYDTVFVTVGFAGINEYTASSIKLAVYPNPANNEFICEAKLNGNEKGIIVIYDLQGRELLSKTLNGKTIIDASSLDNGAYFIQVKTNENIYTQKIIIQH